MTTTHAAMGLLIAVGVARVDPAIGVSVAIAAYAGSVFPDLDVFVGQHRRTLHYPVWYWVLAALATGVAIGVPSTRSVGVATFLGAAALHASTDVLGGGLGIRPWIEDDDRGVYSHYHGRWVAPLRLIRWDGAPEDLVVAVVLSVPALLAYSGVVRGLVVAGLVASVVYTVSRKRLPDLVPGLFT
ncbi:MAG: metal-dependent hydrolase [Halobacteriaceae archaeon]